MSERVFPEHSESDWRALVEKALKGKAAESLIRSTEDDIDIYPLYREPDAPTLDNPSGLPGQFPFLRGVNAIPDQARPWDIRQIISHPDIGIANEQALEALQNGACSVEMVLDNTGQFGVKASKSADFLPLMADIRPDWADIALTFTGPNSGLESAEGFIDWAMGVSIKPQAQRLSVNLDPISNWAEYGYLETRIEAALEGCTNFTISRHSVLPDIKYFRASSGFVHEAGGSMVQELAVLMASALCYIRMQIDAGLDKNAAFSNLIWAMHLGPNYMCEIAKLTAARKLWANLAELYDIADDSKNAMLLQAISGQRMLSRNDSWVNILRNSAACFGAASSGTDIISIHAFTDALGWPDANARRLARNTQLIAQEEAGLGRVIHPAGGAWGVEALSEELARSAWDFLQQIEVKGGLIQALKSGFLQDQIAKVKDKRQVDIACGKITLTGVNAFPWQDEIIPDYHPFGVTALQNNDREADIIPLLPIRFSEDFEALRKRADIYTRQKGYGPSMPVIAIGAEKQLAPKMRFTQNLLAAGGIAADIRYLEDRNYSDLNELRNAPIALAFDADMEMAWRKDIITKCQKAGVKAIYLITRPDSNLSQDDGIAGFIYKGVDMPMLLGEILDGMGADGYGI